MTASLRTTPLNARPRLIALNALPSPTSALRPQSLSPLTHFPGLSRLTRFLTLLLSLSPLISRALTQGDYTYTTNTEGQATITDFNSAYAGALSITNTLGGCPVTAIGYRAFSYCSDLASIAIPDSVTSIGGYAFNHCSSLTSVAIPSSVTSIGVQAFSYCSALTSIAIPDSVTSIGEGAIHYCPGLTNLVIGTGVTSIGDDAFSDCTGLTSVTIPDSVTSIGLSAFEYCAGLKNLVIGTGVTNIGNYAFSDCSSLTCLVIPESVTSIGDWAFCDCDSLTSVTIGSGVISIGRSAFTRCTGLTNLVIGTGVTAIGVFAFSDCTGLTSVTIPGSVNTVGDLAFHNCTELTSILFQGIPPTLVGYPFYKTPATLYYLPDFASNWPSTFGDLPTLCWNPTVQHDASFGFSSDRFGFNIAGTTNIPVKVEATTNLASGAWVPITNATLGTSGSLSVSDFASSSLPVRFYRIVFP